MKNTGTGITILAISDRIACFHSLMPFLFSDRLRDFTFTDNAEWCLGKDKNKTLIMVRLFIKPDVVDLSLLARLRDKYERIAYFHDDAGGGIPRLQVLPFVDLFYAKALFRDRSLYGKQLYGKELYSDHYHRVYGVTDSDWHDRPIERSPEQLAKLRISWNVGIGDYPRGQLRQRVGVASSMTLGFKSVRWFYARDRNWKSLIENNKNTYQVHARFGFPSRPSIAYQRRLILESIEGRPEFLTGKVSQAAFNRETANSKIVLSPFGWGELCLRDFEAVRNGALLLKPDMSHLETWPDIFDDGETYVSFRWDATDLLEKTERYLEDDAARKRITATAAEQYFSQIADMSARLESILQEIEEQVHL